MSRKVIMVSAITFVIAIALVYQLFSLDGLRGLVLSCIVAEDTVYSKDYSDSKFKTIEIGMSKESVLNIMGKPLVIKDNDSHTRSVRWWYSQSPGDTHYRMREVRFQNNAVTEIIHYFYFD